MKEKKIPQRMCIGCGQMMDKKSMLRVVCTPDEVVMLDPGGRANGRGAYLCGNSDCLKNARKSRKLERALKHQINEDVWVEINKSFSGG
ncbi:MAG: YlxR family protein [Eubacteriales bacterium]|nr:YlxR family protein [Eubacteriales bacterium]MDD4327622.1 YlxR family protein [Eubacteriales bacterium]MDD4717104.1 YlxR family protein [Eubacteriales bacterium]NCU27172.1 YlxR family protein [Candidatus Nomurabacteria bacterium]